MINWGPKRIKELETENEELRTLLDGFSAKEERLKRSNSTYLRNTRKRKKQIKQRNTKNFL
ncbi:MAG: hypothetical protein P8X47_00780 [Ignavibacteriaceae bacterium]